ncbi:Phosphoribosylformylglycinamidine synthase subunit PurQ [Frankliniella fusca]|uniref:Phosphoribosylformylglycinamidine synthase subunit PurQ n=1 Tax=Frankliniella fusca TaxID=407009 RepID=A0AAE1LW83_9NEOP|nr:Phosphoribosylformylglycinamidine synthase subunit PurQ [Frankliniella fusca]
MNSDSSEEPLHVRREKALRVRARRERESSGSGSSEDGDYLAEGVGSLLSNTGEAPPFEKTQEDVQDVGAGHDSGVMTVDDELEAILATPIDKSPRKAASPEKVAPASGSPCKQRGPQVARGQSQTPQKHNAEEESELQGTRRLTPQKGSPRKQAGAPEVRRQTPQKGGQGLPVLSKQTPKKTPLSKNTATPPKKSPLKRASDLPKSTRRDTPMKSPRTSPTVHENASSSRISPGKRDFSRAFGPMQASEKRVRQSNMSRFVTSITSAELEDLDREIQMATSPGDSLRSISPTQSEASDDSAFKTPREKSTYRALQFGSCSPSVASGLRHLQSMLDESLRQSREIQGELAALKTITKETFRKILSCVLPPLESNIAEDIPRLPLNDKDGERAFNELISDKKEEFNKVVTFLYGLGGTGPRDALYSVMKTLMTDEFASTKSMKGIRRAGKPPKDAFMGTTLFKAVMCAVRRRFKDSTVSEIMELTGNWLKDAPSRVKKRQRRQESRDEMLQQYEDERCEETS